MQRPVMMELIFKFEIRDIPTEIYLVTENAGAEISVNDKAIQNFEDKFLIDPAFKMVNIVAFVKEGIIKVTL